MNCSREFATVELILASSGETRGVDAFALAILKCERQIRRLFTHLVFQYPCYGITDIAALRASLSSNRGVYFEGFARGFDTIYPRSIANLIGEDHDRLRQRLDEAVNHRNKIFHGQLTANWLTRADLVGYVADIRSWCSSLAEASLTEFAYDGFARDSFRKSDIAGLWKRYKCQLCNVDDYGKFISQHVQRRQRSSQRVKDSCITCQKKAST